MTSAEIAIQMIEYSQGNLHDINHFLKVFSYAKIIGEKEGLDDRTQQILEIAALLHDIACPLCREKYGNTNGKYQEREGIILVRDFLKDSGLSHEVIDRIVYLVGHHHTYTNVDGEDYQILLEADYLVNADESHYSGDNISNVMENVFKTQTGIGLLKTVYQEQLIEQPVEQVEKPDQYYKSIYSDRESMFGHSPYALEEKLVREVSRGNETEALEALRMITAQGDKAILAKDPLRSAKNSMIGSIAFMSRAAIGAGVNSNDAFALSDALTEQVEEMTSRQDVLAFEERILLQFIALVHQQMDAQYTVAIRKVVHYIENHLDTKITLEEAAAYANVHPVYLSSKFKEEVGSTFSTYIAQRKIQESSYFVCHTMYSISQVATLYGFSSQSYYTTVFRKVMGVTPAEYRRMHLAD